MPLNEPTLIEDAPKMTQMSLMEPFEDNLEAAADYRQQAREFLVKGRQYLANGDFHQAAEKGWGAAARMAKAVAETHGWKYSKHDEFWDVMYKAQEMSGDERLVSLKAVASQLHGYFYTRKRFLHTNDIDRQLGLMDSLVDSLEPLTDSQTMPN